MTVTSRLVQEIILVLNEPVLIQDSRLRISARGEVASYPYDVTTANLRLSVADKHMYHAKRAATNMVSITLSS